MNNLKIFTSSEIMAIDGYVGNFATTIKLKDGSTEEFKHGVIVVATGGVQYDYIGRFDQPLYAKPDCQ